MLRPVQISETFSLAIDSMTCLWGGLIAPKLCATELKTRLEPFPHLISFASSFTEDSHLSKENYFKICGSENRLKAVASHACCLVAVFAFESLKNDNKYEKIKNEVAVKFLRHLRNAGAHGNRFNFLNDKLTGPSEVEWKGKVIKKELQGQTAFPDFFAQGDFAYLFEDISKVM